MEATIKLSQDDIKKAIRAYFAGKFKIDEIHLDIHEAQDDRFYSNPAYVTARVDVVGVPGLGEIDDD